MSAVDDVIANYSQAVESDNQWWKQRIADTSFPVGDNVPRAPFFKSDGKMEPFHASNTLGVYTKNVCHMGVPAVQRFNAGPPTPP